MELTDLRNQTKQFIKITVGFVLIVIFALLVDGVTLKNQSDKNHQDYVTDYLLYQAVLHFVSNLFGFWLLQAQSSFATERRTRITMCILLLILISFGLYMTTYFSLRFFDVNENLTVHDQQAKMDWRFRNLLVSYIFYYLCVIQNLLDCASLWVLAAIVVTVLVMDFIESYRLGRSSQFGAFLRGEDLNYGNDPRMQERMAHINKIKKSAFSQLKMQEGADCCICMEPFVEGESTVGLECHNKHVFHFDCLRSWLVQGRRECPLCRVPIRTD
jgi:hypothetical protein